MDNRRILVIAFAAVSAVVLLVVAVKSTRALSHSGRRFNEAGSLRAKTGD